MAAKEVDMIYHLSRVQHHRYSGQHGAAPLSRSSVFPLVSPGSQPSQGWIERLYQHVSALTHKSGRSLYRRALVITLLQQQPIPRRRREGLSEVPAPALSTFLTLELLLDKYASLCLPSDGKPLLHVEAATSAEIHAPPELVTSFHLHSKIVQDGSDSTRGIVLWAIFSFHNTHIVYHICRQYQLLFAVTKCLSKKLM